MIVGVVEGEVTFLWIPLGLFWTEFAFGLAAGEADRDWGQLHLLFILGVIVSGEFWGLSF